MIAKAVLALIILISTYNVQTSMLPSPAQLDIIFTLKHILSAYNSCVHRIVDLRDDSHLYQFNLPLILDRFPTWETMNISSFQYIEDRVSPISFTSVPTLRSSNCLLHVFLSPSLHILNPSNDQRQKLLRNLVNQRYLFRHRPFYLTQRQIIWPESVVILTSDMAVSPQVELKKVLWEMKEAMFCCESHAPTFYVVEALSLPRTVIRGYFFCWYCGPRRYVSFHCLDPQSCPSEMKRVYEETTDFGRSIQWRLIDNSNIADPQTIQYKSEQPCLGALKERPCTTVNELEFVANFIFTGMNKTVINRRYKFYEDIFMPQIFKRNGLADGDLVATGYSTEFHFITSDSVSIACATGHSSWSFTVCLLIFLSIQLTAFLVMITATTGDSLVSWRRHFSYAALITVSLIDQSGLLQLCKNGRRLQRSVLVIWLLGSAALTNVFKSAFNSNHLVEPSYVTTWEKVAQFANFTIFIGYEIYPFDPPYYENETYTDEYAWMNMCPLKNSSKADGRRACALADEVSNVAIVSCEQVGTRACRIAREHNQAFWEVTRRLQLINMNSFQDVLRYELTKPRTAFLSPKTHFSHDWKIVRETIKTLDLMFANNRKTEDSFVSFVEDYAYSSGISDSLKKRVPRQLKALMSSGIYGFWKRWENSHRHSQKQKYPLMLPNVSLTESDIYEVFLVYIICIAFTLMVFLREYLKLAWASTQVCRSRS